VLAGFGCGDVAATRLIDARDGALCPLRWRRWCGLLVLQNRRV